MTRTVWDARRLKRNLTDSILCGRMVDGKYPCDAIIAETPPHGWDALAIATAIGREGPAGVLWLPVGLTDEPAPGEPRVPGEYRWSAHSLQLIADGKPPSWRRSGGTRTIEQHELPITVPCPRRHWNRIDIDLVARYYGHRRRTSRPG